MRIEYKLDAQDFLEYQLFAASNSPALKKQRRTTRIGLPLLLLLTGIVMAFLKQDFVPLIVFPAFAVAWYFVYPMTDRGRYVKFYLNHVHSTYKSRIGQPNVLTLENDFVSLVTTGSESKFSVSQVEEIVELKRTILIKLKSGGAFIIAKNQSEDFRQLRNSLQETAVRLEVSFKVYENWEWK